MANVFHRDLGQEHLHVPKYHASTHLTGGTDPITGLNSITAATTTDLTGIFTGNGSTVNFITNNSTNWDTAYGWGDNSKKGYVTYVDASGDIIPIASGIYDLGTAELAFCHGYIDRVHLKDDPTESLQAATKQYVDSLATGGQKSFFFTANASDIVGMYEATLTYPSGVLQEITGVAGNGETVLATFIASAAPTEYRVTEGSRHFYITAKTSSTAKPVQLRGYVYLADLSGNIYRTLRISSLSSALSTTSCEYTMSVWGGSLVIPTTTRVIFKITSFKTGTGSNPTITLSVGDDTFSRLDVPSPVGVTEAWLQFVNQTDLTGDKTGSFDLTTTGVLESASGIFDGVQLSSDPVSNLEAATKQYVDSQITGENHWDRSGTTLTPHNANDDILITGSGVFRGAASNSHPLSIDGDTYPTTKLNDGSLTGYSSISMTSNKFLGCIGGGGVNEVTPLSSFSYVDTDTIFLSSSGTKEFLSHTVYGIYFINKYLNTIKGGPTEDAKDNSFSSYGGIFYDGYGSLASPTNTTVTLQPADGNVYARAAYGVVGVVVTKETLDNATLDSSLTYTGGGFSVTPDAEVTNARNITAVAYGVKGTADLTGIGAGAGTNTGTAYGGYFTAEGAATYNIGFYAKGSTIAGMFSGIVVPETDSTHDLGYPGVYRWNNLYLAADANIGSVTIGANSLDTNEFAVLDGQDQTVATTSSPIFAGLSLTGAQLTLDSNSTTGYSYIGLGAKADLLYMDAAKIIVNAEIYTNGNYWADLGYESTSSYAGFFGNGAGSVYTYLSYDEDGTQSHDWAIKSAGPVQLDGNVDIKHDLYVGASGILDNVSTKNISASGNITVNGQYNSVRVTDTVVGSAWTTNWDLGNVHYVQLSSGANTGTFIGAVSGGRYLLEVKQPSAGASGTITWPSNVKWANAVTPVLTTANSQTDIVAFYYNGTNYAGSVSFNYAL